MMIDAENTLNEKIRVSINSECAYKLRDLIHKISKSYGSDTTLGNLFIIIDHSIVCKSFDVILRSFL